MGFSGIASSSRFADGRLRRWFGRQITAGPRHVTSEATPATDALGFEARHDGYVPRFGLVHRRRLTLAPDGTGLFGEDALEAAPGAEHRRAHDNTRPFMLRFHLHPAIKAEPDEQGRAAMLTTPGGETWMFKAGGQEVRLEESIFFAVAEGPRRTLQIAVPGLMPRHASVAWSLTRLPPD